MSEAPTGGPPAEMRTWAELARLVVGAASHAPSVHNTQPWWFSHGEQEISLHADTERRLQVADPLGREMMISCGAALFNVRVALRYLGFVPRVTVLPDPDLPNLLARVACGEHVPATEYERRLFAEIPLRRTHRGGFQFAALPPALLADLGQQAGLERGKLTIMTDDRERALAAVVEAGDCALRLDSARAQEQARWAPGPGSHRRVGVPPTAYPALAERIEPHFSSRDFSHGQGWGFPPSDQGPDERSAGVAGVLTTAADDPADWIHAGQALQRLLLRASTCGVAAALHSQPLELPQLRDFIRTEVSAGAYPQMVLRFGRTSETAVSMRLPVGDILL